MILIASGAYLQGEFASEVGLLPPSFLPIGNKRLYEYQLKFLQEFHTQGNNFYLSIPATFEIDQFDLQRLAELQVTVIRVPDGLSLGDSILYCWNSAAKQYGELTLLHGDTLFLNASYIKSNAISVHTNRGFYKRATLGHNAEALDRVHDDWSNDCEQVISGFFRFSQPLFFMKSLIEAKSDFVNAIVLYHREQPVTLLTNGEWLDFGHINSFYHSRTQMTTQRAFNELLINTRSVYKASQNRPKKIFAEGNWFATLPLPLRLYTPALLGLETGNDDFKDACYQLEYLYLLPLSDLFVFGRLANDCWQTILDGIAKMLSDFSKFQYEASKDELTQFNNLYLKKTLERLKEYEQQTGFQVNVTKIGPSDGLKFTLREVAQQSANYIRPVNNKDISVTHGDLCFSNILYDSRVGAIKCIDPRGMTPDGELSLYGDRRYDLAKLYHSVLGLYDLIIAGRFDLNNETEGECSLKFSINQMFYQELTKSFRDIVLEPSGYEEKEILAISVHLFLSMLPLHSDRPERQNAFIANALRLFNLLREMPI